MNAGAPDAGGDVLVRCEDVARTFGGGPGAVVAVRSVTCEIRSGQRLALTGPSGSGKSTLLHLLAGLDEPTIGSVSWPAIGGREDLRPEAVAMVFQGPSLLEPLDVLDNVALPLLLAGATEQEARARAHDALGELDLLALSAKLPEELSGGQAQRVAVARALAGRPRLILADEPTGQLDSASAIAVVTVLVDAARRVSAALVVSTHDERVASRLAERWRMDDGRLLGPAPAPSRGARCSS